MKHHMPPAWAPCPCFAPLVPQHGCASVSLGTCSSLAIWGGPLGVVISKSSFQFLCLTLVPLWVSCLLPSSVPFSKFRSISLFTSKMQNKAKQELPPLQTVIIVPLKSSVCLWCLCDVFAWKCANLCACMCWVQRWICIFLCCFPLCFSRTETQTLTEPKAHCLARPVTR